MSDDAFDYFRAYLISRGRAAFEAALADADSLADCDLHEEGEEWEDWMSPTMMVIHARTGEYRSEGPRTICGWLRGRGRFPAVGSLSRVTAWPRSGREPRFSFAHE